MKIKDLFKEKIELLKSNKPKIESNKMSHLTQTQIIIQKIKQNFIE